MAREILGPNIGEGGSSGGEGVSKTEFEALKLEIASVDTDGTLSANSDSKVASEKATKTYVDAHTQGTLQGAGVIGPAILNGAIFGNGEDIPTALIPRFVRVIVPKSGHLRDLAFYAVVKKGNYNLLVYDTGQASAGKYTLLTSSGSKEVSAATSWQVWDPNLAVTAGQHLVLGILGDSAEFKIAKASITSANLVKLPSSKYLAAGVEPKLAMTTAAQGSIAGVAEIAEATMAVSGIVAIITGVVE